ncbi:MULTISPECIES: thiamine pyrophosphate-dependent enzyme [unclassified Mycobacterium]|uniref:thiamine pyrophosphate-dependent enzyme n=1 Tax=unclassified Mycobacterium TaxID=2642494 RepID=UPI000A5234B2|nr:MULTISPECIES: thiamine pyrophosphate-dependent enzyme [unclassified Mycobacterium]
MTYTTELSATLARDDRLELYRRMWVLRLLDMALDEPRVDGPFDGSLPPALGQEAVAVGATAALRPGDVVHTAIPHFRNAEHVARALPLGPALAELRCPRPAAAANQTAYATDWKQLLDSSTDLARSISFALGDAYAQKLAGSGNVTLCAIGGRDANTAEFTAAASIAVSWRLPLVFVVENIVEGARGRRGPHESRGLPLRSADGRYVAAVADSVADAVRRASAGGGPGVVEAVTYRTNHPCGGDPLILVKRQLRWAGVDDAELCGVERRARRLVAEAVYVANSLLAQGPAPKRQPGPWSAAS